MRISVNSEKHLRIVDPSGDAPHPDRESETVGSERSRKVAKRERFIAIDKRIFTHGLTPGEILVFAYIDQFQGAQVCFATNETIAKEVGIGVRQVQRYLLRLKKKRLIKAFYEGKKRLMKTYLNAR
jgi:hypothetical protein